MEQLAGHDDQFRTDLGKASRRRKLPRLRLLLKAAIKDLGLAGKSSDRTGEQLFDFPIQYGVSFEANDVAIAFFLQHTIHR